MGTYLPYLCRLSQSDHPLNVNKEKVERRIRIARRSPQLDDGTQHHEQIAALTWPERDQQSEDACMQRC